MGQVFLDDARRVLHGWSKSEAGALTVLLEDGPAEAWRLEGDHLDCIGCLGCDLWPHADQPARPWG